MASLLDLESDIRLTDLKTSLAKEDQQLAKFQAFLQGMEATLSSSSNSLTFLLSQMQLNEQWSKRQNRINELRDDIESEELKRRGIKPSRVNNMATASVSPVGTSKAFIAVLGAIPGVMLGLFAAFMVEFLGRVREEDL